MATRKIDFKQTELKCYEKDNEESFFKNAKQYYLPMILNNEKYTVRLYSQPVSNKKDFYTKNKIIWTASINAKGRVKDILNMDPIAWAATINYFFKRNLNHKLSTQIIEACKIIDDNMTRQYDRLGWVAKILYNHLTGEYRISILNVTHGKTED